MFSKKIFSERIKQLRLDNNYTLSQFGKIFGVSKQSAQRWETEVNLPSVDKLYDISKFFQVSSDYLLGLSDNPNNPEINR